MAKLDDLPDELLVSITQYLSRSAASPNLRQDWGYWVASPAFHALLSVSLSCRRLHNAATAFLYESYDLSNRSFNLFYCTILLNPSLAQHVKRLSAKWYFRMKATAGPTDSRLASGQSHMLSLRSWYLARISQPNFDRKAYARDSDLMASADEKLALLLIQIPSLKSFDAIFWSGPLEHVDIGGPLHRCPEWLESLLMPAPKRDLVNFGNLQCLKICMGFIQHLSQTSKIFELPSLRKLEMTGIVALSPWACTTTSSTIEQLSFTDCFLTADALGPAITACKSLTSLTYYHRDPLWLSPPRPIVNSDAYHSMNFALPMHALRKHAASLEHLSYLADLGRSFSSCVDTLKDFAQLQDLEIANGTIFKENESDFYRLVNVLPSSIRRLALPGECDANVVVRNCYELARNTDLLPELQVVDVRPTWNAGGRPELEDLKIAFKILDIAFIDSDDEVAPSFGYHLWDSALKY